MASDSFAIPRRLLIFGIVLQLAVVVGYLMASPGYFNTWVLVGVLISVLLIPVLLRWHHPLLIFSSQAAINLVMLPGQPPLWMIMTGISFAVAVLDRAMDREKRLSIVPALTWPVLMLLGVVLVTANVTGGIGIRTLGGSQFGGKGYAFIIVAIMGYFALSAQRIPLARASRYASGFFL